MEPEQVALHLEQLERQRASLEEEVARSRKREAISLFARGVAHDMNNILASIMGLASIMKLDIDLNGQNLEDLEAMVSACARGRELTQGLLELARCAPRRRAPTCLNHLIREVVETSLEETSPLLSIHLDLFEGDSTVLGDDDQLRQVVQIVLCNSLEAIEEKGEIEVTTAEVELHRSDLAGYPKLEPGRYIRLTIRDDGVGMDLETLKRACKPFFSTKPEQGAGLGLAYVHGVVRDHDGRLAIESEAGVGTTVTIDLAGDATTDERDLL
jgi:signal transduction histidine kinase